MRKPRGFKNWFQQRSAQSQPSTQGGGQPSLKIEAKWWTTLVVVISAIALLLFVRWSIGYTRSNFEEMKWWRWGFFGIAWIWILSGIRIVRQRERLVVEVLGVYWRIYTNGLRYKIPIVMRELDRVSLKEHAIDLFGENPTIDFTGGGTAKLIQPKLWVRVKEEKLAKFTGPQKEEEIRKFIYALVYSVDDWRASSREGVETALRAILGGKKADAVFDEAKQGDWWEAIKQDVTFVTEALSGWGLEVTRITITDFDWDEDTKKGRQQVFDAEHEAQAAKFKAEAAAAEIAGFHDATVRILKERGYSDDKANEIAERYVIYREGVKSGQLVRFESDGGGNSLGLEIAKIMAQVQAVGKAMKNEDPPNGGSTN